MTNPYQAPSPAASVQGAAVWGYCDEAERATISRFLAINGSVAGGWIGISVLSVCGIGIWALEPEPAWEPLAGLATVIALAVVMAVLHLRLNALALYATAALAVLVIAGLVLLVIGAMLLDWATTSLDIAAPLIALAIVALFGALPIWLAIQAWRWRNRGVPLEKLPSAPLLRSTALD